MPLLHFFGFYIFPCSYIYDSKAAARIFRRIDVLAILSMVSPLLSFIGAGSVIIFVSYHRICRSPDINSLFHLSIADALLALIWIIGPIIHLNHKMHFVSPHNLGKACAALQAICEMVHIMSFFLTINYAFNVFLRMKEKKDRLYGHLADDDAASQQRAKYTRTIKIAGYLCSWLIPVALLVPLLTMVLQEDSSCELCIILLDTPLPRTSANKLRHYNGFVLMIITLGFSMIAIITLYFCTLRMYKKTLLGFHTNRERVVIHAMAKRATAYIIVFVYCWTPALILCALGLKSAYEGQSKTGPLFDKYFPLFVLQTLSAPLQGFLNSLVYGWSRKTFREAVARESRQWLNYGSVDSPSTSLLASTETYHPSGE